MLEYWDIITFLQVFSGVLGLILGDSPDTIPQKCIFAICEKVLPRQRYGTLKGFPKDLAKFWGSGLGPRDPHGPGTPWGSILGFLGCF